MCAKERLNDNAPNSSLFP